MLMRRFGLIGQSLSHSFSANFFAEKFEREKITDARYDLFPLDHVSMLPTLLEQNPDLIGLNVTIPYKQSVIPYLDELDEEAREIGAVNCIRIEHGKRKGYNTDAYGFRISIKPFLENKFERALILGTGGASLAVAHVLKNWNIPVFYVSRETKGDGIFPWSEVTAPMLRHFHLIINTTPLGTFPHVDEKPPLPYDGIGAEHFLYDLIYNPTETAFLREGKARGALTMNGLKMLEWQALRSWDIWNGLV